MGLWQRVREGLRRPASPPGQGVEVVARLLPSWLTNKPLPHPHDHVKFAEEGARRNVIIASCIWTLVTSAAEPTFHAGRRKADGTVEPLPDTDPLARLLAAPNPDASPYDFLLKKATFANYETAHTVLWSDTLAPLYRRNGVAFTRGLGREFGEDVVVEFGLGTILVGIGLVLAVPVALLVLAGAWLAGPDHLRRRPCR